jgi:nitrite reductase (NO-forming)
MFALVVVVLIHPFVPQSRWLLVHMVTLGLITTSIMVWGQHFTEALLKTRLGPESRPAQLHRIRLLTAGTVVTCVGMVGQWPWVATVGAAAIGGAMVWYAFALGQQLRHALAPRLASVVRTYMGAACLLPVGAVLGTLLAFSPPAPWQGRLLLAHQVVNVLGFVGLTVCATLVTLWPTVLRTRTDPLLARIHAAAFLAMGAAVLGALVCAMLDSRIGGTVALAVYAAGLVSILVGLVRTAVRSARGPHRAPLAWFPILSIGAGVLWLTGTVVAFAVMWWQHGGLPEAGAQLAEDAHALTVPIVVGFLLQVLLGAMSHLLPVTMGGGPRSTSAALREMSRLALPRVLVLNLVLALFVLADAGTTAGDALFSALTLGTADTTRFGSLSRVLTSLLAFLVLASFLVFMLRGVRASLRERRGAGPTATTTTGPASGAGSGSAAGPASGSGSGSADGDGARTSARPPLERRRLSGALLGLGTVLGTVALGGSLDTSGGGSADGNGGRPGTDQDRGAGSGGAVRPTGHTTTLDVTMADMRFDPDRLEVPAGDRLVIRLRNQDPSQVHDLALANGASSGRVDPGGTSRLDVGVVDGDLEGWCTIVGHRAAGMTLTVTTVGADGAGEHHGDTDSGVDPLTPVVADLQKAPSDDAPRRDPELPGPATDPQQVRLEITQSVQEIASGVRMDAMTYGGRVVGPTIRSQPGADLSVHLVNHGEMGHSLDLHAGTVSPDEVMRTLPPGEELDYTITTDHAGIWLYHCSTMPMSVHLASGMIGALVVPPADLVAADAEFVLVQSDHYLVPDGAEGSDPDADSHPVSPAKIAAGRPDLTVFNGHATQYVHAPLEVTVGDRVRFWVLAAGPSRGISFHVVGAVFDTVFVEGSYRLRPDDDPDGGAQALQLGVAQGGFVETVFTEPGTYTAVNHDMADMERGARALIHVTA